jgi:hypothetical protein
MNRAIDGFSIDGFSMNSLQLTSSRTTTARFTIPETFGRRRNEAPSQIEIFSIDNRAGDAIGVTRAVV